MKLTRNVTGLLLGLLASSTALSVEIIHQDATAFASADGSAMVESLPPNFPGVILVERGVPENDSEYASAALSSEVTPIQLVLEVSADIHHGWQPGHGQASITIDFVATRSTGARIIAVTNAQGGSGHLGGIAFVKLLDADGWIWQFDPSSAGMGCNTSHPLSEALCRSPATMPPGEYQLEVKAVGYLPPDCGSCHGFATGAHAYALMLFTQGAPEPIQLSVARDELTWTESDDAQAYDVVSGRLDLLHVSGGDFTPSTRDCLANDRPFNWLPYAVEPVPGPGTWFLVRAVGPGWGGSYDTSQPGQVLSRNAAIDESGSSCP